MRANQKKGTTQNQAGKKRPPKGNQGQPKKSPQSQSQNPTAPKSPSQAQSPNSPRQVQSPNSPRQGQSPVDQDSMQVEATPQPQQPQAPQPQAPQPQAPQPQAPQPQAPQPQAPQPQPQIQKEDKLLQKDKTSSDYYWNSYAHFSIHEQMLKDKVRTITYRKSILDNAHLVKNKVVLDVGCGTGILSLFAAKAGAAHVYAVDCSDIAIQAQQIVIDNGYKDKITVIHSKMEDVTLPCKVDVILSEWMGYFLLYESMLNTVIYARDHFLVPGGIILPDKANLYIGAIEDAEYKAKKIDFWENVYGFNMECIKKVAYLEPIVDTVNGDYLNTTACRFFSIDLNTVKESDLSFTAPFEVKTTRADFAHALISWFDVEFSKAHKPLSISTSPRAPYTHWKQTVFYLEDVLILSEGETITGNIHVRPNQKNPRDLDIKIKVDYKGKWNEVHKSQEYLLR